MARVLVACEHTGAVRDAFRAEGHDAWSCDLLPDVKGSKFHLQGDVLVVLHDMGLWFDLMVAHPPCTYLSVSGMHWTVRGLRPAHLTEEALDFVRLLMGAPVPRIAIENPVSVISTRIRRPDQIIQPFQFGHPESKKTCLWLKGLPPLRHTRVLPLPASGRWANQTPSGQNKLGPSADRWAKRSATYAGIAKAMARQWGALL